MPDPDFQQIDENAGATWPSRFRARLGDRAIGIVVTLALELLLVAVLLTLQITAPDEPPETFAITSFDASSTEDDAADGDETLPDDAQAAPVEQVEETPQPAQVPVEEPRPQPPVILPRPVQTPAIPPLPQQPVTPPEPQPDRPRAVIRSDRTYGPANTGARGAGNDSQVVGTAPDGQPLYAARWYREPTHQELAGYLSTVTPPSWALIACKTAPGWRVEDCVPIEQYPASSNITNAVLAATWQFQVRPPRRGGQSLVGSWVRIRIDYTLNGNRR